jgi:hypothetical protein
LFDRAVAVSGREIGEGGTTPPKSRALGGAEVASKFCKKLIDPYSIAVELLPRLRSSC